MRDSHRDAGKITPCSTGAGIREEKGEGKKTKDLEQFILSKLKEGRILSCKELSEGSGYERRTVQKALRKLVGENRVKVIGMGKTISYRLG